MWPSGRHRDHPGSLQPGQQQRMPGPDQSTSTFTDVARRHHRPSGDRTRRPSDEARREMLEHFREQLQVALVTTACFTLILLFVYVNYLSDLQEELPVNAADNAVSCQESGYTQQEEQSTWDRFIWRRKASRHSKQPSQAPSIKQRSGGNSPSAKQPQRPSGNVQEPPGQEPALLENWFEPAGQLRHNVYDDEAEGAPLQVVPNKGAVSYVWRHDGASARDSKQTTATPSRKASRGLPSFDAMQMVLFGGRKRAHGKAGRQGNAERGEESAVSTTSSTASATPSRTSRKKEGAPSSPEFNFEEYLERRRREASAQAGPALPDASSSDSKTSCGIPIDRPLVPTASDASASAESVTRTAPAIQVHDRQGDLKQEEPVSAGLATDAPADDRPEKTAPGPEPVLLLSREITSTAEVMELGKEGDHVVPGFLSGASSYVASADDAENRKKPLFTGLDTGTTTLGQADSALGPSFVVSATVPAVERPGLQPASVIAANQADRAYEERAIEPIDTGKSEPESQRPGTEQTDSDVAGGVPPPPTVHGPVLVKDRRNSRRKSDAYLVQERQEHPCSDAQEGTASGTGGADQDAKKARQEDVKHETLPDEEHTTEMVTGAFSVETEKT
ncbi:hypothetical protein V5799_003280 [Amblyomma americanum]|uniref:Transmembrane protein n=1 Tax=Amblyomma americanum TaxID=6943 RepID=A0AAQ4D9E8_AMBAM